ncbi:MAG: BrnA antitoxin family protein [Gemmatimonas sp.]
MIRSLDFSKGQHNPYPSKLKRPGTIRLDEFTVEYFKAMAEDTGIPYQTLINVYLRECAGSDRRLAMQWRNAKRGAASRCWLWSGRRGRRYNSESAGLVEFAQRGVSQLYADRGIHHAGHG